METLVRNGQKQPPEMLCKKRCSQKFRKNHRKTPVPKSLGLGVGPELNTNIYRKCQIVGLNLYKGKKEKHFRYLNVFVLYRLRKLLYFFFCFSSAK